ncbi:MAG: TetR/AcrR family transcriptional regulator [Conexibacter sp.]|nr:TetR/AcrR family transcriptional regulator [Conexibacter sp.]
MARPREFDETAVLRAARGAFRAKGYAGTSLQDLLDVTGLGKGSLYAAFGDKRGLYLRVLGDYSGQSIADVRAALEGPGPGFPALRAYLLAMAHGSVGGPSCLLASSTAELAGSDRDVGACVSETFTALQGSFTAAVRRAQDEGDVDPAADPEALGGLLLAVARGIEALGHAGTPEDSLVRTAEAALAGVPRPPHSRSGARKPRGGKR